MKDSKSEGRDSPLEINNLLIQCSKTEVNLSSDFRL